ncbi:MAG: hypothetical protein HQK81_10155 [Desulfovibrionaceae bacterium]|nr:hypothetical protein [Desulfovibrionaceae bacterium]MBF0514403.1 hypothetical protein [Desulfovibrionaceae bacterium]
MKLSQHAAASLPLGLTVLAATGSAGYALAAALASVCIDLDHILDYLIARRGWRGVKDFFAVCARAEFVKIHLVLHAWEWPIILCGGFGAGLVSPWLAAIGLGFGYHLVFDYLFNRPLPRPGLFYWLSYRAGKGFALDKLICPQYLAAQRAKAGPA